MADWKKGDVVYAARGAEVMNVCSNASPPTDDHECLAAVEGDIFVAFDSRTGKPRRRS